MAFPGVELPLFIDFIASQRQQSYRATSADALQNFPETLDTVWDPAALPPETPPGGLTPNGLPAANVQKAVVTLQPLPSAPDTKFTFLAAAPAVALPPPLVVTQIDRVIPATWGAQPLVPGAYQPVLRSSAGIEVPYTGWSWIVDGVNHFLEFTVPPPAGFAAGPSPPVLEFYRYTGPVAGSSTAVAPANVDLNVNGVTGNDVTGDGSPGNPYRTLDRAYADLRRAGWDNTAFVTIQASSPAFAFPAGLVTLNPGALGRQLHPVVIRGAPRALVRTDSVASAVADPASHLMTITGAAGPYPPNYEGLILRFTSGPLAAYQLPNVAPVSTVEAEAFVAKVDGAGALLLAFSGGGILPGPGDTFVLENLVTQVDITGTRVLTSPSPVVVKDLDVTAVAVGPSPNIVGFLDLALYIYSTRFSLGPGSFTVIGSVASVLTASTLNANLTTVPTTAGIGLFTGAGGGFLYRAGGNDAASDEFANSVFRGNCQIQGSFQISSTYFAATSPDSSRVVALSGQSFLVECWFDSDGGGTDIGPVLVEVNESAYMNVVAFRSENGPTSVVLCARAGGVLEYDGAGAITGGGTACYSDTGGQVIIQGSGGTMACGGAPLAVGRAVVAVGLGGQFVAKSDLVVAATASAADAFRVVGGSSVFGGNLSIFLVDGYGLALDQGGACSASNSGSVLSVAYLALASPAAAILVRAGSVARLAGVNAQVGVCATAVIVDSGSELTAGVAILASSAEVLRVLSGSVVRMMSLTVGSAGAVARVADSTWGVEAMTATVTGASQAAIDLSGSRCEFGGAVSVAASGVGWPVLSVSGGSLDVASTVTVAASGGPAAAVSVRSGADIRGSGSFDITAPDPGVGLSVASASVVVGGTVQVASGAGKGVFLDQAVLTAAAVTASSAASALGGAGTGVDAQRSTFSANSVTCDGCSVVGVQIAGGEFRVSGAVSASNGGGVGLTADSASVVAGALTADNNAGNGAEVERSTFRVALLTATGSAGGSGLYAVASQVSVGSGVLSGNAANGMELLSASAATVASAAVDSNGADGIAARGGSTVALDSTVSTAAANVGYGLSVRSGARATVAAPAPTLTGGAGDTLVGTTGPVAWAVLAGNAPATSTDLFNPTTEQCGIFVG